MVATAPALFDCVPLAAQAISHCEGHSSFLFTREGGPPNHSPNTINYPPSPKLSNTAFGLVWLQLDCGEKMSHILTWQAKGTYTIHTRPAAGTVASSVSYHVKTYLNVPQTLLKHAYQWKARIIPPTHTQTQLTTLDTESVIRYLKKECKCAVQTCSCSMCVCLILLPAAARRMI